MRLSNACLFDGPRTVAATLPWWLVFVAIASFLPRPTAAQSTTDPAEEVRTTEIAFAQTMADRDLEAFLTFVSPEAVFFGSDAPLRGVAAIEAAWAPFFEGDTAPFSWHPDQVVALESGGLALSTGPVHSPSGEVVGRFNSIWRKDPDGRWRIVFDKGS